MRRVLTLCFVSVMIYLALFGFILDRPLTLGLLHMALQQKQVRLAQMKSPKLVILAGSNGPYSHSCAILSEMLAIPCENAGVAVGIGLDDLFTRFAPLLAPGDVVYMPMEFRQYTATEADYRAGIDGGFLLRHDRAILARLPPGRIISSLFCCTLADAMQSLIEIPVSKTRSFNPDSILATQYNDVGDRIDNGLADADLALVGSTGSALPTPSSISGGYGAAVIADFVQQQSSRGVLVVGGMPVGMAGPDPTAQAAAVAAIYTKAGGRFVALPDMSRYPRADFFNGEDHLVRPCQFIHSMDLAPLLAAATGRAIHPLSPNDARFAETCPAIPAGLAVASSNF